MKVVRIIARLNVGGPARHVAWLAAEMLRVGYESMLVTGVVPSGEEDMGYFATSLGVEPFVITEMSREISLRDAVTIWKLYRLFVRERPRIVHTHTAKAGTVGRVAGLLYRWLTPSALFGQPRQCFFVHTYHGHVFHSYYGAMKTWLFLTIEKILARMVTNRIVVISPQQFREIHEEFGVGRREQFAVIPIGIDLKPFADWSGRRQTARAEFEADDDCLLVGIVGRLTEIKNHQLFLQAASLYKRAHHENDVGLKVKFVVIGDGHLRPPLETQARDLCLEDDVIFTGLRDDPENFYPALDIVALTSLNEGTPLTLIEAMANARPVIATAVGGVIDLVGEKAEAFPANGDGTKGYQVCERGVLVQSGDAEGFCRGLMRLVEDKELRGGLSERGRVFVEKNYSKERLIADIKKMYDDLLQPERGSIDVNEMTEKKSVCGSSKSPTQCV